METFGAGRCVNCGFLAKMGFDNLPPHAGSRLWDVERVADAHRRHGSLFDLRDGYPAVPICYRDAAPLHMEFVEARITRRGALPHAPVDEETFNKGVLYEDVLLRDRRCAQWMALRPHWSPEQHLEELRAEDFERERRSWREALSKAEQDAQDRSARSAMWLTTAAVLLAILQVLSVTPESLLWKMATRVGALLGSV